MLDSSKLQAKAGNYRFAPSGAVTDRMLLDIAAQYENQVSRKIAGLTPDMLAKRYTTTEPILETTKYDGEGVFVSYEEGRESFAFNAPSGRVRIGLPVLAALDVELKKQGIRKALFRCELYLPDVGAKAKRANIADVIRVSFNGSAEEIAKLRLVMLDVIMLDGKDLRPNRDKFQETWDLLGKLFGTDTSAAFHRAHGSIAPEKELERIFQERIAAGQEGLVVRRLQRLELAKIKPHLSLDAVVIGYVEGEFEGKYGVTSLLTALSYPTPGADGKTFLQTFCRVGSGFTDQQREDLLGTFSALKVEAPLAMSDSDGRTIHFVKPVHIIEIHGEDLVATSSSERENRTQVFSVEGEAFQFLGLVPFPRLTFATFARLRPDKALAGGGARIEQVTPDLVKPPLREDAGSHPEILRREVFVKADAVRKLLVLKTGNELALPYLIYWTDYSAKRKEPLKVSTECAYNEARAMALADKLIAENVTKGFVSTSAPPLAAPAEADAEAKPKKPRAKKEA